MGFVPHALFQCPALSEADVDELLENPGAVQRPRDVAEAEEEDVVSWQSVIGHFKCGF